MKHKVQSIPNKGKLKNGDNFNYYEDEKVVIACVADGVGGNACDWKASEQACQELSMLVHSEEWEDKFDQLMQLNQITQFDDMTLMVVKN